MADKTYSIKDKTGKPIAVLVRRDKRLKKTSRWERQSGGSILLRIPYRFPKRQVPGLLKQITQQLDKEVKKAKRRTDADLLKRAEMINKKHFGGEDRVGSDPLGGEYAVPPGIVYQWWFDRWTYPHQRQNQALASMGDRLCDRP